MWDENEEGRSVTSFQDVSLDGIQKGTRLKYSFLPPWFRILLKNDLHFAISRIKMSLTDLLSHWFTTGIFSFHAPTRCFNKDFSGTLLIFQQKKSFWWNFKSSGSLMIFKREGQHKMLVGVETPQKTCHAQQKIRPILQCFAW